MFGGASLVSYAQISGFQVAACMDSGINREGGAGISACVCVCMCARERQMSGGGQVGNVYSGGVQAL